MLLIRSRLPRMLINARYIAADDETFCFGVARRSGWQLDRPIWMRMLRRYGSRIWYTTHLKTIRKNRFNTKRIEINFIDSHMECYSDMSIGCVPGNSGIHWSMVLWPTTESVERNLAAECMYQPPDLDSSTTFLHLTGKNREFLHLLMIMIFDE